MNPTVSVRPLAGEASAPDNLKWASTACPTVCMMLCRSNSGCRVGNGMIFFLFSAPSRFSKQTDSVPSISLKDFAHAKDQAVDTQLIEGTIKPHSGGGTV